MNKREQLTRIEKELAKHMPAEGADQARVDRFLKDLHKIYGESQEAESNINSRFFMNLVKNALRKIYGEENLI